MNNARQLKNHKYVEVLGRENQTEQRINAETESIDLIFGVSIARIIQWGSCLCGFIPDTVDLENTEIDEEYVNHLR